MNVSVENLAPCRKLVKVEIPTDRVESEYKKMTDEFQKIARIPGFRPGKAPRAVVEKRYKDDIEAEVKKKLIPQTYKEAIETNKLNPVTDPDIEEIDFSPGKPWQFAATIEVAPDFELPEYKGLEVKEPKKEVTNEMVDQALNTLRDQRADFKDVTGRAVQKGDFAVIDYTGVVEGKPIADIAPAAKNLNENKDFWLLVEDDVFLPGFSSQVIGANVGEKRQANIDFPLDFQIKELAGKQATFFVGIKGLKEKQLPELDDAFAQSFNQKTTEDLRLAIRKELERDQENRAEASKRNQVVEQLLSRSNFELPPTVVAQQTRRLVYDFVRENQMRGIGNEFIEEKKEDIYKSASQNAEQRVRTAYILMKIAEKEKIEVSRDEIGTQIQIMAQQYRMPAEKVRKQLVEGGGISQVYEQIMISKTLDYLLANAKVVGE